MSKNSLNIFCTILIFISATLLNSAINKIYSQDSAKQRVRLKADYFKEMNGETYIQIGAIARIEKKNKPVSHIELSVENEFYDEVFELGTIQTNMKGECKFIIDNLYDLKADSSNFYNLNIVFKGNDSYKKASRSVSIKDAIISAKLITKDSINYVSASLLDKATDSLIKGELLDVQVKRLFRPLKIGKEFNYTDDLGSILVPVENGIPGVDGILTLEVVLNDNDDYGTVKASFDAPIGVQIKEESTFDDRTMWSPRNKTPYLLLIIPSILTFSMWGIIIFLIFCLYKISRS